MDGKFVMIRRKFVCDGNVALWLLVVLTSGRTRIGRRIRK